MARLLVQALCLTPETEEVKIAQDSQCQPSVFTDILPPRERNISIRYIDRYWYGWQIVYINGWRILSSHEVGKRTTSDSTEFIGKTPPNPDVVRLEVPFFKKDILLPGTVKHGDWVITTKEGCVVGTSPICLVLRQAGDRFAIIGQGSREYWKELEYYDPLLDHISLAPKEFEVRFDPKDLIVLFVGQTHTRETMSPEQIARRLSMGVTQSEWSSYAVRKAMFAMRGI
ncbi:hypothetical protein F4819DRAFT_141660 [Hypoxylon fuscum]|nr:hypothetical protein F4819DRAFT_141660 [Hypoxylon fuscum]